MVINRVRNIAFLSTYPPRECGLATFTQDLVRALDKVLLVNSPRIIAINDNSYNYNERVIFEISQHDKESYINTANAINHSSNIDLVVIEHEYGIFGGQEGEYVLDFIKNLKIPFITILHTVLQNPNKKQKHILKILGKKSMKLVTMAKNTMPVLENLYKMDPSKIEFIHHGVPYRTLQSRDKLKEENGLSGRDVISTFGLLRPDKGLEYGIEAVAKVAKTYKDIMYLILGETHPFVKKQYGEIYREKLMQKVEMLGIKDNVKFINKYLSKDEIINYLQMSDIYLTPYLGKEQAVSGTMAYAVGYGRVIISTPYSYAEEMLSEGRGLMADFCDSENLAKHIEYVLNNPKAKMKMEEKAIKIGNTMMWDNIASQYTKLFIDTLEESKVAGSKVV